MITADIQNEKSLPNGEACTEVEQIWNLLGDRAVEVLVKADTVTNPPVAFQHRELRVPLQNQRFKFLITAIILHSDFLNGGSLQDKRQITRRWRDFRFHRVSNLQDGGNDADT